MKAFLLVLVLAFSSHAATYYLAPAANGGSDANNGTTAGTPWLSPNHAVNCGDVISAKASTVYSVANFATGKWGAVTCAGGNNVAWLKCETFGTCKVTSGGGSAFKVSASYWGIQGWEGTTTASGACFTATPPTTGASIHHVVFANNVANGCTSNGFDIYNNGSTASVDYVAMVGNIAWNSSQTTAECDSGFSIYQPVMTDALPGTHIYIAGNFAYDVVTGVSGAGPCGSYPTDGNGIILDSIDFGQGGGTPYHGQIVVENNITVFNGGRGIVSGGSGTAGAATLYRSNTMFGNSTDNRQGGADCAEMAYNWHQYNVASLYNIAQSTAATACAGQTMYAWMVDGGNTTDAVESNWITGVSGHHTNIVNNGGAFAYGGRNTTGTSPQFTNPVDPGQPNCAGKTSTVDCMSTVIANYTPQTSTAKVYGYQKPTTDQTYDPYFPQWLCNVNLPTGLITTHCVTAASYRQ